MAFQKLMYRSAGGTITGNLAGKLIHFAARPGRAGGQPPPGNYDIHPPVNDPIYGLIALMTPSGSQNLPNAEHFAKGKYSPSVIKGTPVSQFQKVEPAMKNCVAPAFKYCYSPKTTLADGGRFAAARKMVDLASGGKEGKDPFGSQVFVLSSRPILGQNSLVIMTGHADLMDALQAAGGASVTVA
jgi:hypothetical protein